MTIQNNNPPKLTDSELSAMRAQAYPEILGDNGLPWYNNVIDKLQDENKRLAESLEEALMLLNGINPNSKGKITSRALDEYKEHQSSKT